MAGIRDLEDVVPRLKEVSDSFEGMQDTILEAYRTLRAATRAQDPYPRVFIGKIKGYRFTSGGVGAAPTHRYEVQCGNGIALHMETSPGEFARVLTDMAMGEITVGKINEKLVIVFKENLRLRLSSMLQDEKVLSLTDRWGNYLYENAPVVSSEYGRGYRALRVDNEAAGALRIVRGELELVVGTSDIALDVDAL